MSLTTEMSALQRIASNALRIAAVSKSSLSQPLQLSASPPLSAPTFPSPEPISQTLIFVGLQQPVAKKISSAYVRTALRLRSEYDLRSRHALQAYARTISCGRGNVPSCGSRLSDVFVTRYLKTLESWRFEIVNTVVARVREIRETRKSQQTDKRTFNQSAIPMLEEFFKHTERPTRAEKQTLARQCDMDYKQINVWFQNRRNRSRKSSGVSVPADGTPKGSLPVDLAAALLRILDNYTAAEILVIVEDTQQTLDKIATSFAPFRCERPQHTFPLSYPPLCESDPFARSHNFPTPWYRSAASSHIAYNCIDTTDLLSYMEKLSLQGTESTSSSADAGRAVTPRSVLGFCAVPPCAPLPALYRASKCSASTLQAGATAPGTQAHSELLIPPSRSPSLPSQDTRTPSPLVGQVGVVGSRGSETPRVRGAHRRDSHGCFVVDSPTVQLKEVHPGQPYPRGRRIGQQVVTPITGPMYKRGTSSLRRSPSPEQLSPLLSPGPTLFSPRRHRPLSRMPSLSSVRSVSSSSSSSTDCDLPQTPPSLPCSLPQLPTLSELSTFDLYTDLGKDARVASTILDGYADYSLSFLENMHPAIPAPTTFESIFEPKPVVHDLIIPSISMVLSAVS
ncbi:hypothetical protein C8Q72DRAFT_807321 [Fomitopsis betulina]|nr:hypothetical protein C8Q72DRAFT_807321 [Fomitopsis betulina]